ncbi:MAG: CarD family transcriptional regulator [candidate division NC10 bacterium]|jgi:CarD family transcriptional regulator|nr:CarD family transcriptional regulator [candidate division NC10 bacterium]
MDEMFCIGKKVVYPAHGVALIEAIEEKEVSGCRQSFYILRILGNDTTILIPIHNALRVGLREVIGRSEIPQVMEILRRKDVEICPNWNRRFKENWERIKSGSLYEMALVLRKLVVLQKERHLSFGEKKMLENVRQLIVSEIAHAAGIDPLEADGMVEKTIATA